MKYLYAAFIFFIGITATAQQNLSLDYYLPQNTTYDSSIPTPQSVLGFVPGKWHVSHDKLVNYITTLAQSSSRITIENRGKTFEDRPLFLLTITSEKKSSKH